ncbi:class I SAM-dependent methyltransferase [Qipengyuania sp. MTN3-11]|uniref:class I SAM-dependent methyltransferase n=1 Tax=Qipengyuania sp. MTN3-11 TaxID=3056557 RepID=UPI0036F4310A
MAGKWVLDRLRGLLPTAGTATVVVVGGGTQRADLDRLLCRDRDVRIIYTDIDVRADVDIFADAHDLPFQDASVDAVVTTAVLEHVMYPERVAAEIARVVKVGGHVYSELPFMQQVHEGAYDFTRYSAVGHQRLLREFTPVECGLVAGPATALVWALEHFFLSFAPGRRSRLVTKAAVRWVFGWLKYIDYLIRNRPAALDGASCTYLLGEKAGVPRSDEAIVAAYAGAQSLSHD